MSSEMIQIRLERLEQDVLKVLAANAANSAYIDKVLTQIQGRLDVLQEDFEKLSDSD